LLEDHDPEEEPERADDQAEQEQCAAVHPADRDLPEIGDLEIRFAPARVLARAGRPRRRRGQGLGSGRGSAHRQREQQHRYGPERRANSRRVHPVHAVGSFGGEIPATLRDALDECQRKPSPRGRQVPELTRFAGTRRIQAGMDDESADSNDVERG